MKKVHIIGDAYSEDFFEINMEDMEITIKPYILVDPIHIARFGFRMADDGLKGAGINQGDYVLISDYSSAAIFDQPILIRQEGMFLLRIPHILNPVEGIFVATENRYPQIHLLSENFRTIGVMSGVIPGRNVELYEPYPDYDF